MIDLSGQVGVVTGGNGGIGLGIAEGLVLAGADVAIWARNQAKTKDAIERLTELAPGRRALGVECDVTQPENISRALAQTVAELGHVDACVANAGENSAAGFLDLSPGEWRATMAVNLDGAFFTLQAAARQMVEQGTGGALVAVSSLSAIHGAPNTPHYAASKAGVVAVVRSAAVALARHGIRVNALLPGWTVTDMARAGYENDRFREVTTSRTPVRRWATPEEFRTVAAYLCDKSQTFHTGDSVVVDGGYTIF